MKFFKWKVFVITSIICLSPILLGISLWDKLPDTMAIHFNFYGTPDNFASKGFVVFALPLIMVPAQWFCCFANDLNSHKHGNKIKLENITKWIIPILSIFLQIITIGYSLGWNLDIRKSVSFIVGVIFLITGNYLPKFDYIKITKLIPKKPEKSTDL